MAKDLMRMLTEITPTQQPVAGTPGFRGMFGQQQAQRLQGSLGSMARGGAPSSQARMQQALSGLNLNKPEDLAKLAKIQQGTGDFAGAAGTAAKVKALRTEEAKAASSIALKEATGQAVIRKYGEDRTDLLALADQGLSLKDINDFAAEPDTGERYKISGKNVFDTVTQKFLAPPPKAEGKAYKVQKFYDPVQKRNVVQWVSEDDANIVYREELEALDTGAESATFQKLVDASSEASYKAGSAANQAISVAQEFDKYAGQIASGAIASVEEMYKGVTGTQDKVSLLRLSFNQLRLGRAIKNLPQGPATDKDIKLVLEGELANNADPATVAQYARGIAKLARKEQAYYDKQNAWYAIYNTPTGFPLQVQKDTIEETFASIPAEDLALIESDPSESNVAYFNATHGVDYFGLKSKLALAERGLSNFDGGL